MLTRHTRFLRIYVDAVPKSLRVPREKHFELQKVFPRPWCFNGVDFQTALAPQRGAKFADLYFKKSTSSVFNDCDLRIALAPQRGANFGDIRPVLRTGPFLRADLPSRRSHKTMGKQHWAQFLPAKTSSSHTSVLYHICAITCLG